MIGWLTGKFVGALTGELRGAWSDYLKAEGDKDKLDAKDRIAQIEARRAIALAEADDRWSATRLGRLLIVVPYGVWWALVFLDSSLGNVLWLDPKELPENIKQMANILVPAIVIADAGSITARRIFKK